jgi:hypothetical protein
VIADDTTPRSHRAACGNNMSHTLFRGPLTSSSDEARPALVQPPCGHTLGTRMACAEVSYLRVLNSPPRRLAESPQ